MATKPTIVLTVTEMARRGGIARARKLSAERQSEIGRKAAQARWAAKNSPDPNGTDGPDQASRPIRDIPGIMLSSRRRGPKSCHTTRTTRKSSAFFNLNLFELEGELAVA
jgi:hypothetical protein